MHGRRKSARRGQGPETVVTASFGESNLKIVVPTGAAAKEGSEMTLVPEGDMLAVFDAESGVRFKD